MRKVMILFALLLVLGIGGMFYAHAALTVAQYDVSFTEVASHGDVSAADGLTVSVQTQLAQHLVWASAHTLGQESSTQTDFDFSSKGLYWESPYTGEALSFGITSDFGGSISGGSLLSDGEGFSVISYEWDSVAKILQGVASRTQNGERHAESIKFNDYYDYYPINANIFPTQDYSYNFIHDDEERTISQSADEVEICEAFSSYFRIPVPENYRTTVEIYKDSVGNVVEISMAQETPVLLYATSVNTEFGVYFALQTEGATDFSDISGGFGIYLLPVSTIVDDKGQALPTLDYHNLSTVYSLNKSAAVQSLTLSEDKSCLNLITIEDGVFFLTVIDLATMTEKQKLSLLEDVGDSWLRTAKYEDGLFFVLLGDARFVLAELNADNIYQIVLAGARDIKLLNDEAFESGDPFISWDGERLALVTATQRIVHYYSGYSIGFHHDNCGFLLEIYDESGLKYEGIYESSLGVLASPENYNGRCQLINSGGLSLSW